MNIPLLSDKDYAFIQEFAQQKIGLHLNDYKRELVVSRLSRRLKVTGIESFAEYFARILVDEEEAVFALGALATHHTFFYREPHHYHLLESVIVPDLLKSNPAKREIKIWVAGCAEGAEAYDIAMLLDASKIIPSQYKLSITATDFNPALIEQAKRGVFESNQVKALPAALLTKYFTPLSDGRMEIASNCRAMIQFQVSNLLKEWPSGHFDIIFCRNVMIYFEGRTQIRLLSKFTHSLPKGGYFIVGHAENLHMFSALFQAVGRTCYKKV